MKRMLLLILVVAVGFLSSCATSHDTEKRLLSGDHITEVYNYEWEKVYDAIKYVLQNSDVYPIAVFNETEVGWFKYHKKEKAIIHMMFPLSSREIDYAIYFDPESQSKTKVRFVSSFSASFSYKYGPTKYIIDESHFILKNDGQGYIKYTEEHAKKVDEERYGKKSSH